MQNKNTNEIKETNKKKVENILHQEKRVGIPLKISLSLKTPFLQTFFFASSQNNDSSFFLFNMFRFRYLFFFSYRAFASYNATLFYIF